MPSPSPVRPPVSPAGSVAEMNTCLPSHPAAPLASRPSVARRPFPPRFPRRSPGNHLSAVGLAPAVPRGVYPGWSSLPAQVPALPCCSVAPVPGGLLPGGLGELHVPPSLSRFPAAGCRLPPALSPCLREMPGRAVSALPSSAGLGGVWKSCALAA